MQEASLDVVTIGNAIVDVLCQTDDAFLEQQAIVKGSMTLIDEARADQLYTDMGPAIEASGGSAANTAAGLASFGAKTGYIGLVKQDELGKIYAHDLTSLGIAFTVPLATTGPGTGRSLILVTPDAERSMNTYLGAAATLGPQTLDIELIQSAQITYMEGYLFDQEPAKEAYFLAAKTAHQAGGQVSLSLSDSFCVDRHRADFLTLVQDQVDILFANEDEVTALYETPSIEAAVEAARADCALACITRGAQGSLIVTPSEIHTIEAGPVQRLVDTTGAGDQYAAGVLYGLTQGYSSAEAGRIGSLAAAEVIDHLGPRPQVVLSTLL